MGSKRPVPGSLLASSLSALVLCCAGTTWAATTEFVDPNPAPGNQFGRFVVALSSGNVVIASPFDDAGGTDAGAVYLFNGATGALISTLGGSTAGDQVGNLGVVPLTNGNYVILSSKWDNGAIIDAGAATWASGTIGVSGVISSANSLVGSTANDAVFLGARALVNGNYLVSSLAWHNGAAANAGAVTWGNGATGVSGIISAGNSLVGSTAGDQVGFQLRVLSNGNYVVSSPLWDNGAMVNAGAATWGSGTIGVSGVISAANSLVGSTAGDSVSAVGTIIGLTNGNYVVLSPNWHNGGLADVGAATWANGATGLSGLVSTANSLVGSTPGDQVGASASLLLNGNYVVQSPSWNNGAVASVGAVTWCDGTTGSIGTVSTANSLVGSTTGDQVGASATPLPNGSFVIGSPSWDNGAIVDAGAVTWANGTTGVVSAANSLVGSSTNDRLGSANAISLTNGNYVVRSPSWDNGAIIDAGAVTWGDGTIGVSGSISAANSLVGSTAADQIGSSGGVTPLANGGYVVSSPLWDNGAIANAGAATWANGTTGVTGTINAGNSLIGSTANDQVGSATALKNGNFVIRTPNWDNGVTVDAGAATWGDGAIGVMGTISSANSLIGSATGDQVSSRGVTPLANGGYVVGSNNWDNGAILNTGAATWGSGLVGAIGPVTSINSLIGATANTNLQTSVVEDSVNHTFIAAFLADGGGRVRVGQASPEPTIKSAVDIPADQGGWLRLTFGASPLDNISAPSPIVTYGIWRHVPGTLSAGVASANPAPPGAPDRPGVAVLADLDVREIEGHFYAVGAGSRSAGTATSFPPGTWEYLVGIPATQQLQYLAAVPTISNAAPNDFVVTAHTGIPALWYISNVATGQSVDNLAPAIPSPFTAAYTTGATSLHWGKNTEPDMALYNVYRGASAAFTPAPGNRISSNPDTGLVDIGSPGSYYKLSAVDENGNESGFALVTPTTTLGVSDGSVAFGLERLASPAVGGHLLVWFTLSSSTPAALEVLDVSGRVVDQRAVGASSPGRQAVAIGRAHPLTAGVYFVRLRQGANQASQRVIVLR